MNKKELKERLIRAIQEERIGDDVSIPQNLVVDEIERIIEREFDKDVSSTFHAPKFYCTVCEKYDCDCKSSDRFKIALSWQSKNGCGKVFHKDLVHKDKSKDKAVHICGVVFANEVMLCSECREDTNSVPEVKPSFIKEMRKVEKEKGTPFKDIEELKEIIKKIKNDPEAMKQAESLITGDSQDELYEEVYGKDGTAGTIPYTREELEDTKSAPFEEDVWVKLQEWSTMLETPENDELDAGIVRDEMKHCLSKNKSIIGYRERQTTRTWR